MRRWSTGRRDEPPEGRCCAATVAVVPQRSGLLEELSLADTVTLPAALARALVVRPSFLVADEPTGRLDEELSALVLTTLRETYAAGGTGVLVASHDPVVVAAADRVVRMSGGRVVG